MKRILILSLCLFCLLPTSGCARMPDNSKAFAEVQVPANLNVVVVLDASGSMGDNMQGGRKIDVAKNALVTVLKQVPEGTNVGILVFSGRQPNGWIYPIQPVKHADAEAAIAAVQPDNGTPLGTYMEAGANALLDLRKAKRYGLYRMLVITDGEANCESYNKVDNVLLGEDGILAKGITIHAIGVNMKDRHTLATKIPYSDANDPASFTQAVAAAFAETNANTAAEDFDLIASLDEGFVREALKALATVDNLPIGQHEVKEAPPTPATQAAQPQETPAAVPQASSSKTWYWVGGIAAIVIVIGVIVVICNCED